MAYKPIEIDRENFTIMGIKFSDLDTLNSAANAIGSNMFEGFESTSRLVEIVITGLRINLEYQLTKEMKL
jgi:putative transcriptional regulator